MESPKPRWRLAGVRRDLADHGQETGTERERPDCKAGAEDRCNLASPPVYVMNDGCRDTMPFARNARHWGLPKAREPGLPRDRLAEVLQPQLCSLQARQEARGSAVELLCKLVDGAGVLLD